jgi:hypothetical protein
MLLHALGWSCRTVFFLHLFTALELEEIDAIVAFDHHSSHAAMTVDLAEMIDDGLGVVNHRSTGHPLERHGFQRRYRTFGSQPAQQIGKQVARGSRPADLVETECKTDRNPGRIDGDQAFSSPRNNNASARI